MGRKQLWILVAGLVLVNCLTVAFFLSKEELFDGKEALVTIGKEEITRQDLQKELEKRYGDDVLKDLVDREVIEKMVDKYDVHVSDKDIEREYLRVKTVYGDSRDNTSRKDLKKEIKYSLLLEELLTKDVSISDEELKEYYEQNRNLYSIPTSYHISHIVLKTKKEAKQALEELEKGSDFSSLAMEKSIDEFSANQGGDLGFVHEEDEQFPDKYFRILEKLSSGKWSEPIQIENGYSIVYLHEKIKGNDYPFKEVKDEIRRQVAIDQMEGAISADVFWNEAEVKWPEN